MNIELFRSALNVRPFRPFEIHMVGGTTYMVPLPELVWQSPGGRTAVVGIEGEQFAILDVSLISKIVLTAESEGKE